LLIGMQTLVSNANTGKWEMISSHNSE